MRNYKANYISHPFRLPIINNVLDFFNNAVIILSEIDFKGSSRTGKKSSKKGSFSYVAQTLKKYNRKDRYGYYRSFYKYDYIIYNITFNKHQLIGKVFRHKGKLVRLIGTI